MGNRAGGSRDSRPEQEHPGQEPQQLPAGGPDGQPGRPGHDTGQSAAGDPYADYRRGLELLGRGSAAAAAQLLERAAAAEPDSRSVLEALARAQFAARRYAAAAGSFRKIVEASPSDDYARFGLGLALARTGDPAAAVEHLALAAAMRPELRHYHDALRSVRATLRARSQAAAGGPERAGGQPLPGRQAAGGRDQPGRAGQAEPDGRHPSAAVRQAGQAGQPDGGGQARHPGAATGQPDGEPGPARPEAPS